MSTYHDEMRAKYPDRPYRITSTWELRAIESALSALPALNTDEENARLEAVRAELDARKREGRK